MTTFETIRRDYYQRVAVTPEWPVPPGATASDMVLHLPVLEWYASQCRHVTEFGVREAHSTIALMAGLAGKTGGKLVSYDIDSSPMVKWLKRIELPCEWEFYEQDTGDPGLRIAMTDMLFIDTLHTFAHVTKELRQGDRVRKYLAFHDTATNEYRDEVHSDLPNQGIIPAIERFLVQSPNKWKLVYMTRACNGLLVLERVERY